MNVWTKMMEDIFSNSDFTELFEINGVVYTCIVSPVTDEISFTDAGLESGENFTLDIKLPVYRMPKINEKLRFRDKTYKISNVVTDSANASVKISVVALSKGISG